MQIWGNSWKIVQKYSFFRLVILEGKDECYMPEICNLKFLWELEILSLNTQEFGAFFQF